MKRLLLAAVALACLGATAYAEWRDDATGRCGEDARFWWGTAYVKIVECQTPPPVPDADGDGIPDAEDECPADPTNTCNEPPPPIDTDGDGIPDDQDECPTDASNTCNDPPASDMPGFVPSAEVLPASGGSLSFEYDTRGLTCPVAGPGIPNGYALNGADTQSVPGAVVPPATFTLSCPGFDPVVVNITAGDPPPPPPPTDTDGDGIPDDEDDCPTDSTNTCEPPPPPVAGGDYRGMPAFPAWTKDRSIDRVYTGGGDISGNGSASDPVVVSCEGRAVSLNGGQITVSGSYLSLVDCEFPQGRLKIGGDHIHIDSAHTSDISKAGFAIATGSKQIWIKDSSAIGHWANGLDRHGFQAGCGSDWIVIQDSESSANSGDGFQTGHGCGDGSRVTNVFVGGMTCEDNRENCLDAKYADGVVFTGMASSGHGKSGDGFESGSDGSSVIFGSDGDTKNGWLIDSETTDPIGVRVEKGDGTVILGNNFMGQIGIATEKEGDPLYIHENRGGAPTFIAGTWRPQDYGLKLKGNTATGSIDADLQNSNKAPNFDPNDNTDLEAKFLQTFGFPLQ